METRLNEENPLVLSRTGSSENEKANKKSIYVLSSLSRSDSSDNGVIEQEQEQEQVETQINQTNVIEIKEDNFVLNRIQARKQPGLYMIHCFENDWRYYGESTNVSGRLSSHKSLLRRSIHPNKLLQSDWEAFGEETFQFVVLFLGDGWSDNPLRRGKELELIILNKTNSYNILDGIHKPGDKNPFWGRIHTDETKKRIGDSMRNIPKDALGRKLSIASKQYASIAQASRETGHSRKLIRVRLNDPSFPDWKFV